MGKDIRSSSSQDCRHLKQQQSYVKDPFRGWRLLGRVIRSGRRRSAQGHFMEGNLLTGVKSFSTLCYHSVSVEAQWTDDIHIQKCSHFPFMNQFYSSFRRSKCKQWWEKGLFRCLNLVAWSLAQFWTQHTIDDDDVISREATEMCNLALKLS